LVPTNCFVDAREFRTSSELAVFLKGMPESEWNDMREAGDRFLSDGAVATFGAGQYARSVLDAVKFVLG
jgi:hypothetical protein